MEKTAIIVLLVTMMMFIGEAKEDMEYIIKELRIEMWEMKGRLSFAEENILMTNEELKAKDVSMQQFKREISTTKEYFLTTNDDLLATKEDFLKIKEDLLTTKEDLLTTNEDLLTAKEDLLTTKEELFTTKEDLLKTNEDLVTTNEELLTTKGALFITNEDLKTKDASIRYLEIEVSNIREPPFTFACGAHYDMLKITSKTISYSNLLYSLTNVAGTHGLDISTGVFTAGYPGTYTVTWTTMAVNDAGDHTVYIYLRKNGIAIHDSYHLSWYTGSAGQVYDQGGRTLVLHLGRGSTVDLYCQGCSAGISHTTFCVSLSQYDVE